jgi:hypothetical protein
VDVGLVGMDQDDLPAADPGEQLQEPPDVGALLRLGPSQQLLDLLPRQAGLPQEAAQAATAGGSGFSKGSNGLSSAASF